MAGSRASDTANNNSDWDPFLLEAKCGKSGFVKFEDQLLDITLKDIPKTDQFLTTPFAPLYPVLELFDKTDGKLKSILGKTKKAFEKGPLDLYKDAVIERFEKLPRWLGKIEQSNVEGLSFLYGGYFYEFAIRLWFELQNMWPPAQRMP